MPWLILVAAGLLEIVWATALKQSDGFTRLWPSAIGIGGAALSFVLLAVALRHLPAGTGYAVWVGIGAAVTAVAGMLFLGESSSVLRILSLLLVVAGVIGLKIFH
jgi:quaternary ammonium compound-resistance protein SugE